MTHVTRALQNHDLSEEGINFGSHTYFFLKTQGHGGPLRMRDQLNAGATSERTRTCKTIHTIDAPIYSNKAYIKGWLWRPNDIRGPCGPKASWHLSYTWGKTPKNPHPGNLSRPEIVSEPAARQARMLPPVPQRWTWNSLSSFNVKYYSSSWKIIVGILYIDIISLTLSLRIKLSSRWHFIIVIGYPFWHRDIIFIIILLCSALWTNACIFFIIY